MLNIRAERPGDYEEIYHLVKTAFAAAEHKDGNEQDLVVALRQSENYIRELALVAEMAGKIVGYALFTKIAIGQWEALALAPLCVLPEFQKQGIGLALIRAGHARAKALGYPYCVVLGSETYYPKAGYIPAAQYGIQAPFDVPAQNFMAIRLKDTPIKISGTVRYADAFDL